MKIRRARKSDFQRGIDTSTRWIGTVILGFDTSSLWEISHRDGRYWTRPYAAPSKVPFRPAPFKSLAEAKRDF